ncbi:hypothetical protein MPSEU_000859800 [Mayamaea pseudoterrestris]|nr:hypothetical protein MPSEU_000859800 [Mayamaea pseudoterrestris]
MSENSANVFPNAGGPPKTPPSLKSHRFLFAKAAGLDTPAATKVDEAGISPSIVADAADADFNEAGLKVGDRIKLRKHFRTTCSMASLPENFPMLPPPPATTSATAHQARSNAPETIHHMESQRVAGPKTTGEEEEETEMGNFVGDEFDDYFLRATAANADEAFDLKSVAELNMWEKTKIFYNKVIGGDFAEEDGSMIIIKSVLYFSQDVTTRAFTKRTRMIALNSLIGRTPSKSVNDRAKEALKNLIRNLMVQETKDLISGLSNPHVVITYKDTLHMLNSLLMSEDNGIIPTRYLELIHYQLVGQVTGKRSIERNTIAASSWQLRIEVPVPGGQKFRMMSFIHCYMKEKGLGTYIVSFMEADSLEMNLVVITLILLERKGMIRSAIDVYEGREQLSIDPNIFETPAALLVKIKAAEKKAKVEVIKRLRGDEEADETRSALKAFISHIIAQDKPGDKIPFYTNYHESLLMNSRSNAENNANYRELGERCGYRPTQRNNFSATGGRAFCRQASRNVDSLGVEIDSHLNKSLSHSSAIALKHYENANAYREIMPVNIFHPGIDYDMAVFAVNTSEVTPAFKRPEFFKPNWTPQLAPLPPAIEFITKQAFRPLLNCPCPVIGCSFPPYYYAGDLRAHVHKNHSKGRHTFLCKCNRTWDTFLKYRRHIGGTDGCTQCPQKDLDPLVIPNNYKPSIPPPGVAYFLCNVCPEKYFTTRKGVTRHISEDHKGAEVGYNDGLFCPPVASAAETLEAPSAASTGSVGGGKTASRKCTVNFSFGQRRSTGTHAARGTAIDTSTARATDTGDLLASVPPTSNLMESFADPFASVLPANNLMETFTDPYESLLIRREKRFQQPDNVVHPTTAAGAQPRPQSDIDLNPELNDPRGDARRRLNNSAAHDFAMAQPHGRHDTDSVAEDEITLVPL